ncbi:MAG: hypothetical protein IJS81_02230 [Selenomonadaceae bacterium]|nr:hypothetical protein [Selenomonadaceae bacterium]
MFEVLIINFLLTCNTGKYGQQLGNVLSNAAQLLKANGVMGFVILLSYISTPRIKEIR